MSLLMALVASMSIAPAHAVERVLILDATVSGSPSLEQVKAEALGFTVDIVDSTTWETMTTADFASYRGIVLGDPNCITAVPPVLETTASTWGAAVDGNVVINGTDPVFHASQGGEALTERGIAFATDAAGKTGVYISLSCYYHGVAANTPVPMLDGLGTFTATGVGCFNDAHIVATHPALLGLTDADLSNWGCSVHEAFDTWPSDFTVLAIAEGAGGTYTAPDGSVGIPYILARGEGLAAGDISLAPASATKTVGETQTLTATVGSGGDPLSGQEVTFEVLSGPHVGVLGTATTGTDGTASIGYQGTSPGTDTIVARFTRNSITQTSNESLITWEGGSGNTAPTADAGGPYTGTEGSPISLSGTSGDADGDSLTHTWSVSATSADPGASCVFDDATALSPELTCDDDGEFEVTLTVSDGTTSTQDTAVATVANAAPGVVIGSPIDGSGVLIGDPMTVMGSITDPGTNDTHSCEVDFGDGTTVAGAVAGGECTATHTYSTTGVFTVEMRVEDDDGGIGTDQLTITAFGPGFITGGGWLENPKVHTGFVAGHDDSGDLIGQLQVSWSDADGRHRFHAETVDSLTMTDTSGTWSGSGRYDGTSGYGYEVTATDNGKPGKGKRSSSTPDHFTLKITAPDGTTVVFSVDAPLQKGNYVRHD